jgi:hypothetical protein
VILADNSVPRTELLALTKQISQAIIQQIRPLEEWGVLPYFSFLTQSEHARNGTGLGMSEWHIRMTFLNLLRRWRASVQTKGTNPACAVPSQLHTMRFFICCSPTRPPTVRILDFEQRSPEPLTTAR